MDIHQEKVKLFENYGYKADGSGWAVSAGDMTDKQWNNARKHFASGAERGSVIGFFDTTVMRSGKNGYLFTDEKVYYLEMLEKPKKLWYDDIKAVYVVDTDKPKDKDRTLLIELKDGSELRWDTIYFNKTPLCEFFDGLLELDARAAQEAAVQAAVPRRENRHPGIDAAGLGLGNYGNVNKVYDEEKFHSRQGHGFAAERANNLYDRMTGHDAKILGDDNSKNGADRMVDGIFIQSKYCADGVRCINECFENGGSGAFRYTDMQIEVPADQEIYDAAVKAMEKKIANGQVPGVEDPAEAKNIVRKGHFTYAQARNIAKAGTVESITYDAANGAVIAGSAFGVTAVLTFATSLWNGEDVEVSLKNATYAGIKVGGTAFITSVLASQLSKAGLNSALVGSSEAVVRLMGPKASAVLINAFRSGTGKIYGAAAMKSAAKLLRGNVITAGITVAVLSTVDVVNIFQGRISGKQLAKNVVNTTGTVVGGTAGWAAGAAAGSMILPGVGTVLGGLAGSLLAGGAAGKVASTVTDLFAEDDADEMVKIIQKQFEKIANDYLLNQKEAEKCVDRLADKLTGSVLKDMYASSNRADFARQLILPIVEKRTEQRQHVNLPTQQQALDCMRTVLEEIATAEEQYA